MNNVATRQYGGIPNESGSVEDIGVEHDEEEFNETQVEIVKAEDKEAKQASDARRPMTKALPRSLRHYIEHIAIAVGVSFVAIIGCTVWIDIVNGMESDD